MGGIGSGRSYGFGGRPTVERRRALDVRRLHRQGCLKPGASSIGTWLNGAGGAEASMGLRAEPGAVVLNYHCQPRNGTWEAVEQRIPVIWTPCRFGGRRPWFVCTIDANGANCGRRAALLYLGDRLFACRRCYRLAYASQSERAWDRALRRANKIRTRLGGEPDPDAPLPRRPKGMHRRTYERLIDEIIAAEEVGDARLQRLIEGFDRRFGRWRQVLYPEVWRFVEAAGPVGLRVQPLAGRATSRSSELSRNGGPGCRSTRIGSWPRCWNN